MLTLTKAENIFLKEESDQTTPENINLYMLKIILRVGCVIISIVVCLMAILTNQ
jgi:hypothetical protein